MLEDNMLAVCLLLKNSEGKILAVSRRHDLTQWGLPGGKVDPGEDLKDAIVREVFEETSLVVSNVKMIFVYPYVPVHVLEDIIKKYGFAGTA